jgi:hypothetical protein
VEKLTKKLTGSQDSLGSAFTEIVTAIKGYVIPIFNGVVSAFSSIYNAINRNADTFIAFGRIISTYVAPVLANVLGGALHVVGKIAGGVIDVIAGVIKVITNLITGAIDGINLLIRAYNSVPFLPNVSTIPKPSFSIPTTSGSSVTSKMASVPSVPSVPVPSLSSSGASGASGGGLASAASSGSAAAVAASSSALASNYSRGQSNTSSLAGIGAASGMNITVNQGIVGDQQSAARAITDVINSSFYSGTLGASAFARAAVL